MFMKDKKSASLFQKEQVMESLKQVIREVESAGDDKESDYVHCGVGDIGDAGSLRPLFGEHRNTGRSVITSWCL